MIKVGIIGCGYWGGNIARNLFQTDRFEFIAAQDTEEERSRSLSANYLGLVAQTTTEDMLQNDSLVAVVITTPASTHYELAKLFLKAGKHVLVEKPACSSAAEMTELHQIAKDKNKVLMIDHTYLYSGPINSIKNLLHENILGQMLYIDSVRINLGKIQPDINVVWDLATHDISIINHLMDSLPKSVQVSAASHLPNQLENIAYISLHYPNNVLANIHVSWSSPIKRREMIIAGSEKMLVYNDLKAAEKLTLYHCGHDVRKDGNDYNVTYRTGDSEYLAYDDHEPLKAVILHFAEAIENPHSIDSKMGFDIGVLQVLEAAQKSIDNDGAKVFL